MTIENFKIDKYKDMGKEQEEGVMKVKNFRQYVKDSFIDQKNRTVKPNKMFSPSNFPEFFNRRAKKNILKKFDIIDNAFSYIMDHVVPPDFCRHFSDIDQPIKMSLTELRSFK